MDIDPNLLQWALVLYVTVSPMLFLWFHQEVMRQTWNDDFADRILIRLYVWSNVSAVAMFLINSELALCLGNLGNP